MIKRPVLVILLICAAFASSAPALSAAEPIETAIGETYFEEYGIYEDSFPGDVYFYCNVRNGDITEGPVKFDFPADVTVKMQKDGTEAKFPNRKLIKDMGSYALTITSGDYVGYFRFRIQARPVQASPEPENPSDDVPLFPTETYPSPESPIDPAEDPQAVPTPEPTVPPMAVPPDITPPDDSVPPGASLDIPAMNTDTALEMTEGYDVERSMFTYSLLPDVTILSSVPNGMLLSGAVRLEVPDDVVMTVTRDDVPFEVPENTQFWEAGVYRCTFSQESVAFMLGYSDPPVLVFRILPPFINNVRMVYPPVGFTITRVKHNELDVGFTPERALFSEDGRYEIEMMNSNRLSFTFGFTLDTVPPVFALSNVDEGRSTAPEVGVSYVSDDIETVAFIKDGVPLEKFSRNAISDTGRYIIDVADKAGNHSTVQFEMGYQMNGAAILAIIAIVLLIGLICVAFYYIKRKTVVA